MSNLTGIGGGNSIGYKELFLDKSEGGKSLNEAISDRFDDVNKALKDVQANPGDPAKLMTLQMAMNALQQVMSTTTQLINSLKSMTEGINRNI
jgi:type III secretion apparatus needle protein